MMDNNLSEYKCNINTFRKCFTFAAYCAVIVPVFGVSGYPKMIEFSEK